MAFGLTDVAGLEVGHFTDTRRPTGCTVILARGGAVAGVDVRGASPGTRETDLLAPVNAIDTVHAIVLAGGSAFGLDAASGVMRWLDERGIGISIGPARREGEHAVTVPIVPAAILFDLWVGDARIRPDAAAGYTACELASTGPITEGNVGAGAGASVGKLFGIERAMKGGLGTASIEAGGFIVAALVAVNAMGDVIDPANGRIVAGARSADGARLADTMASLRCGDIPAQLQRQEGEAGAATTIAVVATDAVLTKAEATKVAQMAHDGLARSINPIHTMGDGDVVFALATGASGAAASPTLVGALAADVLADAVLRAVRAAQGIGGAGLPDLPCAADLAGAHLNKNGDRT